VNVAFPALAILLLVLPGILYSRYSSTAGAFRRQLPLTDELGQSLVAAIALQVIGLGVAICLSGCTKVTPDIEKALMLISGHFGKPENAQAAIDSVALHWGWVLLYMSGVCIAGILAGLAWRKAKGKYYASKRIKLFDNEPDARRYEEWSHTIAYDGSLAEGEGVVKIIATIVDVGKTSFLYRGILEDIRWCQSGDPDHFVIRSAERRPIGDKEDHTTEDTATYYPISGDVFLLRYSEIKTLNLLFAIVDGSQLED
jgi:hypothetical protein